MNEIGINTWKQAIAIVNYWMLSPEDEEHDNECAQQGDGTSHNQALRIIRARFEEELSKAARE